MAAAHPDEVPSLLFANAKGEIVDYQGLHMAGSAAGHFSRPDRTDLIELPPGSELFVLPGRLPVGIEPANGEPALLATNPYQHREGIQAVAAFMAPAHTAIHTAAFQKEESESSRLPLFAYTAVGWYQGKFWVSAFRSDKDRRQDADRFDQQKIDRATSKRLQALADNRLVQHLGTCCLTYGCPAARNYFLGRWEAPLPCSPLCNASCAGCISLQPSGCCAATQDRIKFVPTPKEIAAIAVDHLATAPRPIVSFGQGCEGEPLLQAQVIEEAIDLIRSKTDRGTINLNTNASLPEAVERLAMAGLDSIRVSLNSARPREYHRYYSPKGYGFTEVKDSIGVMKRFGRHVSLNYFISPGFTDDPEELAALDKLIENYRPDLLQLRNLNMDPEYYLEVVQHKPTSPPLGIPRWLARLKAAYPWLRFGYFNPSLRS